MFSHLIQRKLIDISDKSNVASTLILAYFFLP